MENVRPLRKAAVFARGWFRPLAPKVEFLLSVGLGLLNEIVFASGEYGMTLEPKQIIEFR
jgi:hypothetical protein